MPKVDDIQVIREISSNIINFWRFLCRSTALIFYLRILGYFYVKIFYFSGFASVFFIWN